MNDQLRAATLAADLVRGDCLQCKGTCGRFLLLTLLLLFAVLSPATIALAQPAVDRVRAVDVVTNSVGMKLARIPPGRFVMGSPLGELERTVEEIPHAVIITQPFLMGIYEVTQADFEKVMGQRSKSIFNSRNGGGPLHPVEDIEYKDVLAFCEALSNRPDEQRAERVYRLPTEAEWEYACRAGTNTPFSFGDSLSSQQANFNGNYPYGGTEVGPYLRRTAPVGSYSPNAFGLYDMHGNVAEWCGDWYDRNYYRESPTEDPFGPPLGVHSTDFGTSYIVIRGGSWLDDARACRSAYRFRAMPKNSYRFIGFRVVADINPDDS